jgi:hypothetical protein
MAIKVKSGGSKGKAIASARTQAITTVSTASAIKIGNLEDNVGNIDTGSGLQTGQTIVYNTTTGKWVATSFDAEVDERVDEVIDTKVSEAIAGSDLDFDGGTY